MDLPAFLLRMRRYIKPHRYGLLLVSCGLIGLTASIVLTVDKVRLTHNPAAEVGCNINPIISCGSVMKTPEASLFGFANSLIGIPAFAVVIIIGLLLLADRRLPRWVWWGLLAGATGGVLLTHYLFYQSVYHIHALCPYCMSVWVITMLIFWYTLLHTIRQGYWSRFFGRASSFLLHHHLDIFILWAVVITTLIITRFWYFFRTL